MTLGERIKKLRKDKNLTQQEFATEIGSTQNVLANYETGRRNPSSSVINNICKTFNINETWLRTGEGEMFIQQSREDELSSAVHRLLDGESSVFKTRLIKILADLGPREWDILEGYALKLVQDRPPAKSPPDSDTAKQADLEREADEFAAMAREQFLSEKLRESQAPSARESDAG